MKVISAATICYLPFESAGTVGLWPSAPVINDALWYISE